MGLDINSERKKVEKMSGMSGDVTRFHIHGSHSPQDLLYNGYIPPFMYQQEFVNLSAYSPIGDDMLKLYNGTWEVPASVNIGRVSNATGINEVPDKGPSRVAQSMPSNVTSQNAQTFSQDGTQVSQPSNPNYILPLGSAILGGVAGAIIFHEHRLLGGLGAAIILGGIGYVIMKKI